MNAVSRPNEDCAAQPVPPAVNAAPRAQGLARHPLIVIEVEPGERRDHPLAVALYRACEFVLSLVLLILTLPIILLQIVVIKLDTPGPALFFQARYGRSRVVRGSELIGRTDLVCASGSFDPDKLYWLPTTFRFVKFRTMYMDADKRFPNLYSHQFDTHEEFRAAFYKSDDDPRVTRAGRWLRRLTVDELPNLWSVLTGHIGLVGPRPEGLQFLPYYSGEEMKKLTVRPGITGLAVINGRGNLCIGGQLDWDLVYVRDRSVWMDIKVLLMTAWLVLVRRGAF